MLLLRRYSLLALGQLDSLSSPRSPTSPSAPFCASPASSSPSRSAAALSLTASAWRTRKLAEICSALLRIAHRIAPSTLRSVGEARLRSILKHASIFHPSVSASPATSANLSWISSGSRWSDCSHFDATPP